jgi:hypothetical protein
VPYKDPEQRRLYQQKYQRQYRAQKRLTKADQPRGRKAYLCFTDHHLRIPGITFIDSLFITDNPEEQARIEGSKWYGHDIFSWRVEP